jgi:hypothetical protein
LCCLPGISFACQASQAAALRKKAWLAQEAFWRSITHGRMIFGNYVRNRGLNHAETCLSWRTDFHIDSNYGRAAS